MRLAGGRAPVRRVSAADRAGRARGRGARERPGRGARAGLRRLRRPLRQPHARARPACPSRAPTSSSCPTRRSSMPVAHAEEGGEGPERLAGTPVVCCSLHSQVAPACAALGRDLRVAYVQLRRRCAAGVALGRGSALRADGYLSAAVAVGPCVDGDVACVTPASALLWCAREGMDAIVCASARGSSAPPPATATAASPPPRPRTPPALSGGRRSSLPASPRPIPASATAASPTTPWRRIELCLGPVTVAWPERPRRAGVRRARSRRVDVTGLARGLRRPAALAHGPRARRGSLVLRRRLRGGRPGARRLGARWSDRKSVVPSGASVTRARGGDHSEFAPGIRASDTRRGLSAMCPRAHPAVPRFRSIHRSSI